MLAIEEPSEKIITFSVPVENLESTKDYNFEFQPWVKILSFNEDFINISVPENKKFDLIIQKPKNK